MRVEPSDRCCPWRLSTSRGRVNAGGDNGGPPAGRSSPARTGSSSTSRSVSTSGIGAVEAPLEASDCPRLPREIGLRHRSHLAGTAVTRTAGTVIVGFRRGRPDRELTAALPGCCPDCGGRIVQVSKMRPTVTPDQRRGRPVCRLQAARTSQALGAAGSRLGPRLKAWAAWPHYRMGPELRPDRQGHLLPGRRGHRRRSGYAWTGTQQATQQTRALPLRQVPSRSVHRGWNPSDQPQRNAAR